MHVYPQQEMNRASRPRSLYVQGRKTDQESALSLAQRSYGTNHGSQGQNHFTAVTSWCADNLLAQAGQGFHICLVSGNKKHISFEHKVLKRRLT